MTKISKQPLDAHKRRSLKTLAGALGLSLTAAHIRALADFVPASGKPEALQVFTPAQWQCAGALAEVVIPSTDTPGAGAVGAHSYLDHHLHVCASSAQQDDLTDLLDRLNSRAQQQHKKAFAELDELARARLVEALDQAAEPFGALEQQAWRQFIPLVVFAYYTSEVGASQELSYLPIPGGYDGDVPFSEVKRAWSLQPFV